MSNPEKSVLYLGMGHDALTPMLLVPDFERITAIDVRSGEAFDDTMDDIMTMFLNSSDEGSWWDGIRKENGYDEEPIVVPPITEIKYSLRESEIPGIGLWDVDLVMDGKKRKFEYYYGVDFHDPWSPGLGRFGHVMAMGAVFHARQRTSIINLLNHAAFPFFYYEGHVSIKKYPVVLKALRGEYSEVVRTFMWSLLRTYTDIKGTMTDEAGEWQVAKAERAMMDIFNHINPKADHNDIRAEAIRALTS